eukprot:CCRYP_020301-RA/>CCRYP_020301-RA protein AED:0.01 eAED:0.01 QI:230/1/1/1/1/1/2/2101/728
MTSAYPRVEKSTALLFDDPTLCNGRLVNLVMVTPSRESKIMTCFYEEEGSSSTCVEVGGAPMSSGNADGNEKALETSRIFDVFDTRPLNTLCAGRYGILSSEPSQQKQDMQPTNECIQYMAHSMMGASLFKSPTYYVSLHDVQEIYKILSQLLMLSPNVFSCGSSIKQYPCPCHKQECRADDVLTALGCQWDWEKYHDFCNEIMMHSQRKKETKQLRVCLTVDLQSMSSIVTRQEPCNNKKGSSPSSDVTSNQMNRGSIFILRRFIQPLISITVCQIIESEMGQNTNVMSNPLLRSCVKRLFVGRTILHCFSEREEDHSSLHHIQSVRTILSVKVPSSPNHDLKEGILLSYRVTSVQASSNPSSQSNDDKEHLTRYVILPSTRIIFQTSEDHGNHNVKQQIIQEPTTISPPWLSSPTHKTTQTRNCLHHYPKALPPHQQLLESLKSMVLLNNASNASQSPPILRSFLFSGPPGVGKTFAVKQAISTANSWFASATAPSQQEHNPDPIKLVSLRGSELLASTSAGGHYAAAARELETQFRLAASFCESKVVNKMNTTGLNNASTSLKESETKAVVIFLDECDALVSSLIVAAMLAMLLDLMESGVRTGWEKLLVVAATNRVDAIPSFLRRPGRLEKEVVVSPPNAQERLSLLKGMLETTMKSANNDDCPSDLATGIKEEELQGLADMCVGYVAADLAALVRRAAILSTERYFTILHLVMKRISRNLPLY